MEGLREERGEQGYETSRERYPEYTVHIHTPSCNAVLAIDTLLLLVNEK